MKMGSLPITCSTLHRQHFATSSPRPSQSPRLTATMIKYGDTCAPLLQLNSASSNSRPSSDQVQIEWTGALAPHPWMGNPAGAPERPLSITRLVHHSKSRASRSKNGYVDLQELPNGFQLLLPLKVAAAMALRGNAKSCTMEMGCSALKRGPV